MAWIFVIVVLPVAGIVLYLMLGEVRTGSRRRRHRMIQEKTGRALEAAWKADPSEWTPTSSGPAAVVRLASLAADTRPRTGHRVALLGDTNDLVQSLLADIENARHHIHLQSYIYLDDAVGRAVAAALERAARRGVACRALLDNVGSSRFLKSELCARLRKAGARVEAALPTSITQFASIRFDMRNHRKLVVIDGAVGYTGSHNVSSEEFHPKPRYAPWVDAAIRLEGPCVRDLQALFVEDWFMDTAEDLDDLIRLPTRSWPDGVPLQVVGTGANSLNQALVRVIQCAVHMAREELVVTTPYFVPDEGTVAALTTAAMRGVRTVIVVPARNDSTLVRFASRSFYLALMNAGAEVHEFTEGLLHAKTITVDRTFSLVSSANLDRRSFEINFEVSTLVYDEAFSMELRALQERYLKSSRRVRAEAWRKRPWPRRLGENAAGLVSPLL